MRQDDMEKESVPRQTGTGSDLQAADQQQKEEETEEEKEEEEEEEQQQQQGRWTRRGPPLHT